ncbi:Vi polysaccharide biosynthesis protein VipA/TviB [Jiulongibacter sediminis]|nr:Vi polysaccharide biosynthesis protein VipA/TviB [Jiulongibacter sediminis]
MVVVGLGYVGLPLAVEFGKKYPTMGFDINKDRIKELKNGFDRTKETSAKDIQSAKHLTFTNELNTFPYGIRDGVRVYIITVPTPIDQFKKPDLVPLISASETVGKVLKTGDIVIYESTVYPGCTEEDCVPVLEKVSGLTFNQHFFCGYSPERINPGDKVHTVTKIRKVTSGSTPEVADFVDNLYSSIITAGTYKAASIKVAEAAKVIENCQRDINIAFVNELSLIFNQMNVDTSSVLEAAGTKWNFLPFKPGLVGGHCIGVDPYYLTYKAESLGYHPQVILSGRRINDNMGKHVASETVKLLIKSGVAVNQARVLVLGITFKENCPDIRNSRVIDIIEELADFDCRVDIYDPWADKSEVKHEYQLDLIDSPDTSQYQGIVLAVGHADFFSTDFIKQFESYKGIIFDVKGVLPVSLIDKRL